MADASRQEKLAAARKKLKQFQQQKTSGKTPSNSPTASKPRSSNKTKKNKSNSKKNTVNNDSDRALSPETTTSATTNCTEPLQPPISSDTSRDDSLNVSSPSNPVPERPMSSTESLRQISRQLNGLMSEASFLNSMDDPVIDEDAGIRELESRNRELASALETNVQTNQQLTLQHEELERVEHESKMLKEIGALKEQLQVHIQTIGILVSEKSELQTSLNHSQMTLKQKLDEVDNLSTRLQASRHRTAELERDLASRTNSSNLYEKTSKEFERSRDQLKMDVYNLR
uniref:Golgin subfamily A member 2-like n=1 Tax=Saccoglossus kowalevskii TaxID=10224 RepID=A0ABM0MZ50_SACKO|nr:PREDICTED: golgin subfamily A member 2-like [Saccoglossus kowalevskii]